LYFEVRVRRRKKVLVRSLISW